MRTPFQPWIRRRASRHADDLGIAAIVALRAFWLATSIADPVVRITNLARRIARGDVDQQVEHQAGDEIGQLADAFCELTDYIRDMATVADQLAQGDLTVQVEARSETDVLSHSFGRMAANLREVFVRLNAQAEALSQASQDMSAISEQVSDSAGREVSQVIERVNRQALELARMGTELKQMVDRFNVGENDSTA